jgi:hypothetical protein
MGLPLLRGSWVTADTGSHDEEAGHDLAGWLDGDEDGDVVSGAPVSPSVVGFRFWWFVGVAGDVGDGVDDFVGIP